MMPKAPQRCQKVPGKLRPCQGGMLGSSSRRCRLSLLPSPAPQQPLGAGSPLSGATFASQAAKTGLESGTAPCPAPGAAAGRVQWGQQRWREESREGRGVGAPSRALQGWGGDLGDTAVSELPQIRRASMGGSPRRAPSPVTKKATRAAGTQPASPVPPQSHPGATAVPHPCPLRAPAEAPTLNVCFLLMLSEGCTAATRKLSRGMLPRMFSSFSSGEGGGESCGYTLGGTPSTAPSHPPAPSHLWDRLPSPPVAAPAAWLTNNLLNY